MNLDEAGDIGPAAALASLIVVTSAVVCLLYALATVCCCERPRPGAMRDAA